jgi:uncharacterized lipoprotein YmbA
MIAMTQPWKIAGGLQAIVLLALAACASPNPDIYTLQAVPGATIAAPPQTIEVRRPGLAGYLDRADIVLHDTGTQLTVNSQQRWAEPIGDMIGRVLTEDLGQRLPNSTVFGESGAITADPTLRVEIDIQRFDQGPDGHVTLIAETALEAGRTHTPLKTRRITLQTTPIAPGAAALATALSTLLGQLADLMAQDVGVGP